MNKSALLAAFLLASAGDVVPIRLVVEDAKGKRETVDVKDVARQN